LCRLPKNVTDDHEVRLLELLRHLTYYADQWDQFLQFSSKGDETWFSDTTPEIKRASLLLKHVISPRRGIQGIVASKKIMATAFGDVGLRFLWISFRVLALQLMNFTVVY
jgi:hypothetical protein